MLNRRIFDFELDIVDICQTKPNEVGCVKQLDGTTFNITLLNKGIPMDLSDCVVRLFAHSPKKDPVFQKEGITYQAELGIVSIDVVDEILENIGDVIFEVEIVDLDGYIETTPSFTLHVIDKLGDDSDREIIRIKEVSVIEELKGYIEESVVYIDRYKELVAEMTDEPSAELLQQVIQLQKILETMAPEIEIQAKRLEDDIILVSELQTDFTNSEGSRNASEVRREESEAARETSEKIRGESERTRVANELIREEMEILRQEYEALRVKLEEDRISSEEDRIFNEEERVSAEEERLSSEEERNDAEYERNYAENDREINERIRVDFHTKAKDDEELRGFSEIERNRKENERLVNEGNRVSNEKLRVDNEAQRVENEKIRINNETARQETVSGIKEDMEAVHEKVDNLQYDTKFETSIVVKGNLYPTTDGKMPVHFGPPTKDGGNVIMPYARAIGGMTKDGSGVRTIGFIAKPKDANKELDITEEMNSDAVFLGTNVSQLFLYSKERYPTIVSEGELSPLATQDWVMRLVSGLGLLEGVGDTVVAETSSVPSVFFDKKFSDEWSSVPGDWMISDEQKAVMLPDGVKDLYKPLIARDRFNEISYIKGGSLEDSQSDIFVGLWKTTNYIYGFRMMKNTLSISYFGTNGSRGGAVTFTIREAINPGDIVTLHYNFINDIWEIYKFDDNNEPILVYQMSKFIMSGFPEFGSGKQVAPTLSILVNEIGGFQLTDCPNPGPIRDHGTINEYIF